MSESKPAEARNLSVPKRCIERVVRVLEASGHLSEAVALVRGAYRGEKGERLTLGEARLVVAAIKHHVGEGGVA